MGIQMIQTCIKVDADRLIVVTNLLVALDLLSIRGGSRVTPIIIKTVIY